MPLIDSSKIVDSVIAWINDQKPIYNTIINYYFIGRQLSVLFGRRQVIPSVSLPSIEVALSSDNLSWKFCRVIGEKTGLEIDITVDHNHPEPANRCLTNLAYITTRVLAAPPHLQGNIIGTPDHLFNALPNSVSYRTIDNSRQRVATVTWEGERLDNLVNNLFDPVRIVPPPIVFPPN